MNYLHLAILELEKRSPLSAGFAKEQLAALQQERDKAVKLLANAHECVDNIAYQLENSNIDLREQRELAIREWQKYPIVEVIAFLRKVQS